MQRMTCESCLFFDQCGQDSRCDNYYPFRKEDADVLLEEEYRAKFYREWDECVSDDGDDLF